MLRVQGAGCSAVEVCEAAFLHGLHYQGQAAGELFEGQQQRGT